MAIPRILKTIAQAPYYRRHWLDALREVGASVQFKRHRLHEPSAFLASLGIDPDEALDGFDRWRPMLEEVRDRVAGLDTGADDYLGKPFDLDELAARIRAMLRRQGGRATPVLNWNGLELDPAAMTVTRDGQLLRLSRREFAILHALAERPGRILSRAQLEERLYGWQEDVESNTVEVHIHHLRAKLGREVIETVRGLGYCMPVSGTKAD